MVLARPQARLRARPELRADLRRSPGQASAFLGTAAGDSEVRYAAPRAMTRLPSEAAVMTRPAWVAEMTCPPWAAARA
jgi:hypothetical protein